MHVLLVMLLLILGFSYAEVPAAQEKPNNREQDSAAKHYDPLPPLTFIEKFGPEHYRIARAEEQKKSSDEERRHRETIKVATETFQANDDSAFTARWAALFALAAIIIAFGQYWMFSDQLDLMKIEQHRIITADRAYLVCVGVFGNRREDAPPKEDVWPEATHYKAPWRMVIHNLGRTPGYITKVEWLTLPAGSRPPKGKKISFLLDNGMRDSKKVCRIREVIPPTEAKDAIPFRYVPVDRKEGEIFLGRITFVDIFRKYQYSTFCYKFTEVNSEPVGLSFENDRGDIPEPSEEERNKEDGEDKAPEQDG